MTMKKIKDLYIIIIMKVKMIKISKLLLRRYIIIKINPHKIYELNNLW